MMKFLSTFITFLSTADALLLTDKGDTAKPKASVLTRTRSSLPDDETSKLIRKRIAATRKIDSFLFKKSERGKFQQLQQNSKEGGHLDIYAHHGKYKTESETIKQETILGMRIFDYNLNRLVLNPDHSGDLEVIQKAEHISFEDSMKRFFDSLVFVNGCVDSEGKDISAENTTQQESSHESSTGGTSEFRKVKLSPEHQKLYPETNDIKNIYCNTTVNENFIITSEYATSKLTKKNNVKFVRYYSEENKERMSIDKIYSEEENRELISKNILPGVNDTNADGAMERFEIRPEFMHDRNNQDGVIATYDAENDVLMMHPKIRSAINVSEFVKDEDATGSISHQIVNNITGVQHSSFAGHFDKKIFAGTFFCEFVKSSEEGIDTFRPMDKEETDAAKQKGETCQWIYVANSGHYSPVPGLVLPKVLRKFQEIGILDNIFVSYGVRNLHYTESKDDKIKMNELKDGDFLNPFGFRYQSNAVLERGNSVLNRMKGQKSPE